MNFRMEHAETAAAIAEALVKRLDMCLHGQVAHVAEAAALYRVSLSHPSQKTLRMRRERPGR